MFQQIPIPQEITYELLLFSLFVAPKVLQRYRIPGAITSPALGSSESLRNRASPCVRGCHLLRERDLNAPDKEGWLQHEFASSGQASHFFQSLGRIPLYARSQTRILVEERSTASVMNPVPLREQASVVIPTCIVLWDDADN